MRQSRRGQAQIEIRGPRAPRSRVSRSDFATKTRTLTTQCARMFRYTQMCISFCLILSLRPAASDKKPLVAAPLSRDQGSYLISKYHLISVITPPPKGRGSPGR